MNFTFPLFFQKTSNPPRPQHWNPPGRPLLHDWATPPWILPHCDRSRRRPRSPDGPANAGSSSAATQDATVARMSRRCRHCRFCTARGRWWPTASLTSPSPHGRSPGALDDGLPCCSKRPKMVQRCAETMRCLTGRGRRTTVQARHPLHPTPLLLRLLPPLPKPLRKPSAPLA